MHLLIDIHPGAICEKMGSKYASLPTSELDRCNSLYEDLLRYLKTFNANIFEYKYVEFFK